MGSPADRGSTGAARWTIDGVCQRSTLEQVPWRVVEPSGRALGERVLGGERGAAAALATVNAAAVHGLGELVYQERFVDLLQAGSAALERTHRPGHLTASTLVVHPGSGEVVVLEHTKLRRWLQPGGHVDGNGDLVSAAARELVEETGLDSVRYVVPAVALDIHRVAPPSEDPHLHFDVRFVALAASRRLRANHESTDLRWVTSAELAGLGADAGLLVLAARALVVANLLS